MEPLFNASAHQKAFAIIEARLRAVNVTQPDLARFHLADRVYFRLAHWRVVQSMCIDHARVSRVLELRYRTYRAAIGPSSPTSKAYKKVSQSRKSRVLELPAIVSQNGKF